MRRFGALATVAALFFALVISNPAAAFGGWHGGWRGAGWRGGWNGGWNRWNRWNGWGGYWGWGWGAGLLGAGLGYGLAGGWDHPYYGYDWYAPNSYNYYYPNYAYSRRRPS